MTTNTKCPVCGSNPCYISFLGNVECSNANCKHFSADLYPANSPDTVTEEESYQGCDASSCEGCSCSGFASVTKVVSSTDSDDEEEVETPTYMWSNQHHDFGD